MPSQLVRDFEKKLDNEKVIDVGAIKELLKTSSQPNFLLKLNNFIGSKPHAFENQQEDLLAIQKKIISVLVDVESKDVVQSLIQGLSKSEQPVLQAHLDAIISNKPKSAAPLPSFTDAQQDEVQKLLKNIEGIFAEHKKKESFFQESAKAKNVPHVDVREAQCKIFESAQKAMQENVSYARNLRSEFLSGVGDYETSLEYLQGTLAKMQEQEETIMIAEEAVKQSLKPPPPPSSPLPPKSSTATMPAEPLLPKDIQLIVDQANNAVSEIQAAITRIKEYLTDLGPEAASNGTHKAMQAHLQTAQKALEQVLKVSAELKKLDITKISSDDLTRALKAHEKQIEGALDFATTVEKEADELSYIPRMYRKQKEKVNELEEQLEIVKQKKTDLKLSVINYAFLGSDNRQKLLDIDSKIKAYETSLATAERDLAQWHKGNFAYEIEIAKLTKYQTLIDAQQRVIEQIRTELSTATPQEAQVKKRELAGAQTQLKGVEAEVQATQSVIHSQIKSFMNTSGGDTLLMERGGHLGFNSRVVKLHEVGNVIGSYEEPESRSVVAFGNKKEDLYYLHTKVQKDEAILSTKTYATGAQAILVQTKGQICDKSNKEAVKPYNDEIAVQTAIMAVLNREKGAPIVLSGSDREYIQKIHATLLWMKSQTKDTVQKMCGDLVTGKNKSKLDLTDLRIISNYEGPQKAGRFGSQAREDQAFIAQHMPKLNTVGYFGTVKEQLVSLKDEHKTKHAHDQVLGMPTENQGPRR